MILKTFYFIYCVKNILLELARAHGFYRPDRKAHKTTSGFDGKYSYRPHKHTLLGKKTRQETLSRRASVVK